MTAHNHYYKDVSHLKAIDIYRVLELFAVTDPVFQHVAKKVLVAGNRGHKDIERDVQDMIDSLTRWQAMQKENEAKPIDYQAIADRAAKASREKREAAYPHLPDVVGLGL